ncbi:class I SAM-dependent methyltransferase [Yersinia pekkanenii]|uniref:Siderophore biosysnthesis protein n=1 Tax=Yersinia pekkanenii TaxID=1288385 RepID=A0A0T9PY21_9GAMM|nr:class I SAM-dependent methyltransferase [Yersinia pekkanenii]CNH87146.1 siderophore biosysnthesis protein [Yersinia pekkanenii]CRY63480.1 siderophore biosysnthesis protein [Yersinia pekkanenii]
MSLPKMQDIIEFNEQMASVLWLQLDSLQWSAPTHTEKLYSRWWEHSLYLLNNLEGINENPLEKDRTKIWEQWNTYCEKTDQESPLYHQVTLINNLIKVLPAVLNGEILATEVLFPQGKIDLVGQYYYNDPLYNYFSDILAQKLINQVKILREEHPNKALRILEIGAGTGGTSARLFKQLLPYTPYISKYVYTDISQTFLNYAQKNYTAQAPYMCTQLLNINDIPISQNYTPNHFDIILAANVLHATPNIAKCAQHIKILLKPQGLLLLYEIIDLKLFAHLTFGLLEGWWLAEDLELRIPGTPSLTPENWALVLNNAGFTDISFPALTQHDLGFQIISAKNGSEIYSEP